MGKNLYMLGAAIVLTTPPLLYRGGQYYCIFCATSHNYLRKKSLDGRIKMSILCSMYVSLLDASIFASKIDP